MWTCGQECGSIPAPDMVSVAAAATAVMGLAAVAAGWGWAVAAGAAAAPEVPRTQIQPGRNRV